MCAASRLDQHRLHPDRGISDVWWVSTSKLDDVIGLLNLKLGAGRLKFVYGLAVGMGGRYDDEFPMERVLESWDVLVARFKRHWNLFALDLKNENHGIANWGTGEPFSDWKMVRVGGPGGGGASELAGRLRGRSRRWRRKAGGREREGASRLGRTRKALCRAWASLPGLHL